MDGDFDEHWMDVDMYTGNDMNSLDRDGLGMEDMDSLFVVDMVVVLDVLVVMNCLDFVKS